MENENPEQKAPVKIPRSELRTPEKSWREINRRRTAERIARRKFTAKEKGEILALVELSGWDVKAVASKLGIHKNQLHRWVREAEDKAYSRFREYKRREFQMRIDSAIEALTNQLLEVIPDTKNLTAIATALGIAIDKLELISGTKSQEAPGGAAAPTVFSQTDIKIIFANARRVFEQVQRLYPAIEPGPGPDGENGPGDIHGEGDQG